MSTGSSKISFLQNNVARTTTSMHTCLQLGIEQKIDFILFQEPWISENHEFSVKHSSYYSILPENKEIRSRVAIYARKQSRFQASPRFDIISDNDCLIIDIMDTQNQLGTIQLINIYNEKSLKRDSQTWTLDRC